MSPPRITPADWLDDLAAEFEGLATGTLGLASVATLSRGAAPPPGMEGAYLGLVLGDAAYQIGVAAPPAACAALARSLLGVEGEEALPPGDVADAVCEIVNILAGGVKRRVHERTAIQAGLGLPTFFHGAVQPTERLGVAVAEVRAGDLPAALLVLHPRERRGEET